MGECNDGSEGSEDRQGGYQSVTPTEVVRVPASRNATHTNAKQRSTSECTSLVEAETQILADNWQGERQQDDFHCVKQVSDKSADQYVPLGYSSHGFTWL
ncbi:hypothetical protein D9M70_456760 [compost metagenome]